MPLYCAGYPDVERLARKLEAKRASLADLCQLYRASAKLALIEDALRCHEGPAAALLCSRWVTLGTRMQMCDIGPHGCAKLVLIEDALRCHEGPAAALLCSRWVTLFTRM